MAKEKTVKEAEKTATEIKSKADCEKAILAEAMRLTEGKEHSMQQLMAYCRQLKKAR